MSGRHHLPSNVTDLSRRRGVAPALALWILPVVVLALLVTAVTVGYGLPSWPGGSPSDGECSREDPITLSVLASPDHATLLTVVGDEWVRSGPRVDGRCVDVVVQARASAEVANTLGVDWDEPVLGRRPDVWAPESSVWARSAALRPEAAPLLAAPPTPLATTPLVLAMPRPMAEAVAPAIEELGSDGGTGLRWSSLPGLFPLGEDWSRYGQDWGPFRVGISDPTQSATGLTTLLAVADPDRDGTVTEAEALAVLLLERSVGRYATLGTAPLLSQLAQADGTSAAAVLDFVSAFPATEQEVAAYNGTRPTTPLVALYPAGGIDSDHPYQVLTAPWVTEDRRRAAQLFADHLRGESGARAYADAGFRTPDRIAPGRLGPDLGVDPAAPAAAPLPTDPSVITAATRAWALARRRANLLAVVDTSGSMAYPVDGAPPGTTRIAIAQQALLGGLALLSPETSGALWEFADARDGANNHRELVPLGPLSAPVGDTTRREATGAAVLRLAPGGGTGLHDTVLAAYREVKQAYDPDRLNIVLLITDGQEDNDSDGISREEMLAALQEEADPDQPVRVNTVAYGPEADAEVLQQISTITGGRTFDSTDPRDIEQVLRDVQRAAVFG